MYSEARSGLLWLVVCMKGCCSKLLCTEVKDCMQVVNVVSSYGLPWQNSFAIIVLLYFYSHYLFASGAAHIGAMYTAFLSVAIACGTPGLLAAVALGQVQPPHPLCCVASHTYKILPSALLHADRLGRVWASGYCCPRTGAAAWPSCAPACPQIQ